VLPFDAPRLRDLRHVNPRFVFVAGPTKYRYIADVIIAPKSICHHMVEFRIPREEFSRALFTETARTFERSQLKF
jgi:hypothetical protein